MNIPECWKTTFDTDILEYFHSALGDDVAGWNLQLLLGMQLTRNLNRLCSVLGKGTRIVEHGHDAEGE